MRHWVRVWLWGAALLLAGACGADRGAPARPAEARPAEARPAEAQPAEAQPAEAQPAEAAGPPLPRLTPEPARDFTLETLAGETVTLSDLRGQWVILNFWATWCGPCVREMAYLEELAQTRAVQVLGVNFNEARDVVARFVAEQGVTFPILLAPDEITLLMYQVRALPRTFVIAPDGTLATQIFGEIRPAALEAWLDAQGVGLRTGAAPP